MRTNCSCLLALYGPQGLEYTGAYYLSQSRDVGCYLDQAQPPSVRLPR